ncbi:MAG: homoserine kinase [Arthrobacter sp.]|uniref:homoserine kinase n=1 Tax=Arthrobacter sp. TaxID=1667 RepID=UPI00346FFC9A
MVQRSVAAAPTGGRIAAGQSVTVTVPATSANLGPGYDSMGLALGLRDTLRVATTEEDGVRVTVSGEGSESLPDNETHLVARTILERWEALGLRPAGLAIHAENRIPHGRGLGSSAAAVVSALLAADALVPHAVRDRLDGADATFAEAARLEGHPDNVAPAVYGGLTLALQEEGRTVSIGLDLDDSIVPVVAVPDVELSTHRARGLIPASVPHAVAAENGARVGLLVAALAGRTHLLLAGTEDFLHQRFRAEAMPHSASLIAGLRDAGFAAVVSGAGPTVLVLTAGDEEARGAVEFIERHAAAAPSPGNDGETGVSWRVWMPGVDRAGAKVEVH